MLRKLAEVAAWLDACGLFAEADKLDSILVKCAQRTVLEPEDEPEPAPEDSWKPQAYHDFPEIHSAAPNFMEVMKSGNPSAYEWWQEELAQQGLDRGGVAPEEHTTTNYLMGRPIRLPRGLKKKMSTEDLARFVFPDDTLARNEEETLGRFDRMTRNRQNRATMDIDYVSSQQPKSEDPEELEKFRKPRQFSFDPHLYERVLQDYSGKGPDPASYKLPVFDPGMLRQLFDPADVSDEALALREKVKNLPPGGQLGYALRNIQPSKSFGIGRSRREVDPESGRRKPFFYPKLV